MLYSIMSLDTTQQIQQLLKDKKNILIVFRKDAGGDAIAGALALLLFLEKFNKTADVICDGFELPSSLKFLKKSNQIKPGFSFLQKFILTVDIEKTGIQELSYDTKDNKLRIFITPKQGYLNKENIRAAQSDFRYDLIITLNSADLESLGSVYDNNTELFYKSPLINIDNRPDNEHYGQINIVDITATSIAEVLFDLFKKVGEEYLDEHIATALLAGIISETKSFKSDSVKPATLANAGKLIGLGADREKIISNFYRTRTIPMLKLWGCALAHMKNKKETGLVWSTITRDDFTRCGAREADLKDIIDELINNSPEAKITLLLHEHADGAVLKIHGLISTNKNHNAKAIMAKYNPRGTNQDASFIMEGKTLKEAENEIVEHIQTTINKK